MLLCTRESIFLFSTHLISRLWLFSSSVLVLRRRTTKISNAEKQKRLQQEIKEKKKEWLEKIPREKDATAADPEFLFKVKIFSPFSYASHSYQILTIA